MIPVSQIIHGGNGGSAPAAATPNPLLATGLAYPGRNINPPGYASEYQMFINLLRQGAAPNVVGGGATFDQYGAATLNIGDIVLYKASFDQNPQYSWLAPVNWTIRTTSGASINLLSSYTGGGISNIQGNGTGHVTFDVTNNPTPSITFQLSNNSATPVVKASDLVCCQTAQLSLHDAGELFNPDYLAEHSNNVAIRNMDLMGTNGGYIQLPSQIPADDLNNVCGYTGLYTSIRLAKKLNQVNTRPCALHFNVPAGSNGGVSFQTDYANNRFRFTGGALTPQNGYPCAFYGSFVTAPAPFAQNTPYYMVNVQTSGGYTWFQLSATLGGSPIVMTITSDIQSGNLGVYIDPTPMYKAIAKICRQMAPELTYIVEMGNENWNFGFDQYGFFFECARAVLYGAAYTATGGSYEGGPPRSPISLHALKAWSAFESYFPRAQIIRMFGLQTTNTFNNLQDAMGSTDYAGIIAPNVPFASIIDQVCVAPYITPQDSSGNGLGYPEQYAANGNSTAIPDSYFTTTYGNAITNLTAQLAGLRANLNNYNPNIQMTMYEGGDGNVYQDQPAESYITALAITIQTWLNGPSGLATYQAWYAWLKSININVVMHFTDLGGYGDGSTNSLQFSLKPNMGPDNVRSAWFKTL